MDAFFILIDGYRDAEKTYPVIVTDDNWMVGDTVSILFDIDKQKQEAIDSCGFGLHANNGSVQIPFKVIERRHGVAWKQTGHLQRLGSAGITLQATSGHWEDVFRWVCFDEKPTWAES